MQNDDAGGPYYSCQISNSAGPELRFLWFMKGR